MVASVRTTTRKLRRTSTSPDPTTATIIRPPAHLLDLAAFESLRTNDAMMTTRTTTTMMTKITLTIRTTTMMMTKRTRPKSRTSRKPVAVAQLLQKSSKRLLRLRCYVDRHFSVITFQRWPICYRIEIYFQRLNDVNVVFFCITNVYWNVTLLTNV